MVEAQERTGDAWKLKRSLPVDGGRDRAIEQAAETARTCGLHGMESGHPETLGRRVFRLTETSWPVETRDSRWSDVYKGVHTETVHVRISVAELEYARETPAAELPPKGRLRRAFGRG
ncbi:MULTISPECIES: hypothetical protein [unclassified Streptomyces]|uniref:hypothetical protein n=1 Tax=unclassified Streptomyces TaxID=2593676 RepID=UPI0033B95CFC